jgi:hypothetical protein
LLCTCGGFEHMHSYMDTAACRVQNSQYGSGYRLFVLGWEDYETLFYLQMILEAWPASFKKLMWSVNESLLLPCDHNQIIHALLVEIFHIHEPIAAGVPWRLGHPPHLDTVTLRPALSDTVTNWPKNIFILWHSDPGVGLSEHPKPLSSTPQKWVETLAVMIGIMSRHYRKLGYSLFLLGLMGQCRTPHTNGAHKKWHRATWQNSTNAWVSRVCALT